MGRERFSKNMKLDRAIIEWIENTIPTLCFGEVSITFVIHDGQVVSVKKNVEEKQKLTRD